MTARSPIPADLAANHGSASDAQLKFVGDLLAERVVPEPWLVRYDALCAAGEFDKSTASKMITALLDLPKRPGAARPGRFPVRFQTMELDGGKSAELGFVDVDGSEVPQGKYALDVSDLGWANDLALFNLYVARGSDGPFYSLKMYVSDDLVKMSADNQREVLARIAKDPAAASALYGQNRVRCGVCNRKLTADESRARGIGPVCADRLGW